MGRVFIRVNRDIINKYTERSGFPVDRWKMRVYYMRMKTDKTEIIRQGVHIYEEDWH